MTETLTQPRTTSGGGSTNQVESLFTNIRSTADAMEKGDVLGSAMGVTNVAMNVLDIAGDPLGAISSAGLGWVLGAVSFLREPFEILKGDSGAVSGSAQSWGSASSNLCSVAGQYRSASSTQTRSWSGSAGDGYRRTSGNQASGLDALSQASRAVSGAITQAGQAVAQARQAVMDLIGEAVQKIIQICIEALSKSWLSFGASVAMGIAQSTQKAVQTGAKLIQQIQKVVQTLQKIIKTVQQIMQVVQQVKQLLETIGGRASGQQQVTPSAQQIQYNPNSTYYQPNDVGQLQLAQAQTLPQNVPIPQVRPAVETQRQYDGPTSQNGWPVNTPLVTRDVPGTNVRLRVAEGPAGEVLIHVASQVSARVENVSMDSEAGERDDWGHAHRNVRGGEAVSNHASGTAIDLNATRHPLGVRDTFTPEQQQEIRTILHEVDNVVRWGGDYRNRADDMHFEIIGSQEEVAAVAARLRNAQQQQ
ncbi:M15 family metallopeptidase [Actinophytocola glycyrrhizae]|uniref:M15 family metallopeptidase n=1 Tax=Actinophytocola glycyrrhizae TaxID=2044873 RepID=A0ABV9RY09_9PSEU